LYNEQQPDAELAKKYEAEDAFLVAADSVALKERPYKAVAGDFLGRIATEHKGDMLPVTRSLIRHDSPAVAKAIVGLYNSLNVR
jgi:hypothetical protein